MEMDAAKKEIIHILDSFDRFCNEHEIKYTLGYGTLLGAMRHKGFIPWDDDVDVVLTTSEYLKFRECVKPHPYLDSNHRYLVKVPGDKDYGYSFIKIIDTRYRIKENNIADRYSIGLFIDVFRVDYWPVSGLHEFYQLKSARFLNKINEILIRGNIKAGTKWEVLDKLLRPVDLLFSVLGIRPEKVTARLESKGLKNRKNNYVGNIMSGSGRKSEKLPLHLFDEYTLMEFEGKKYPAIKAADAYLKLLYGDYMVLPDKSKQVGHEYTLEKV